LGHYTHALTLPQGINLALSSLGPTALLLTGLPYIPFYLVTAEFFAAVRAHMRPEGLLMMNLFDNSPSAVARVDRCHIGARVSVCGGTLGWLREPYAAGLSEGNIGQLRFARGSTGTRATKQFKRLARRAAAQVAEFQVPAGTIVFTDDFGPVEEMTRRMLNRN